MALPIFRCGRLSVSLGLNRLFAKEGVHLIRTQSPQCPASAARISVTLFRPYSSDRGPHKQKQKVFVLDIFNPAIWIRSKVYYFLVRAFFDKYFTIEEFTEGAEQAFSCVSRLLSQCQFQDLEGLVATDLISKLEEKCNVLPSNYKKALSADRIMYTAAQDVGIYYDDNGRAFLSILMGFWYLTSARLPAHFVQIAAGRDGEGEPRTLLAANYKFQREITKGVEPDWTITQIEHFKLLD